MRSNLFQHRSFNLAATWLICLSLTLCSLPAIGLAADARALDPVTLQLKWTHAFQFAGYYAALEKGYYRDAGLDVKLVEATPGVDPIKTVIEGQAQFGVGTSSLLLERKAGRPVVALAVIFQHSPYVLIARHDSATQGVHDLVGKRIMLEPQSDEILAYLKAEGLPLDRIARVEHSYDPQDLVTGRVDAIAGYVTNQPYYLDRAHFEYQIYTPRSAGIDFYGDNLFTTEQELREHPARAKAFRAASLRGWQYAMEHPEETVDLIVAKYSQRHSRDYFLFEARQMIPLLRPELIELGYMYPGRWRHIAEVYAELGMVKADFDLKGFLYDPNPPPPDLTWLYVFTGVSTVVIAVVTVLAVYIHRINVRLRQEAAERKRAEEALSERESRHRILFENAPIGVVYSTVDGKIISVNQAYAHIMGYATPEELKDLVNRSSVAEILYADPELRPETVKQVQRLEGGWVRADRRYRRKDGTIVLANLVMRALPGSPDELEGFVEDITDRTRAEESLRAAKDAAEAATQVKEQFLAKLSHELRTPLTPVLLVTSQWQTQADIPATVRDDLAMVRRNLELEARLLDDLLDANRILYGKLSLRRTVVSVHQAIGEAMAIVDAALRSKQLKLTVQLQAVRDRVDGDPARVQQVFWNLLGNAIKFTPEAGSITVRTANDPDGHILVEIADSGVGIEPGLLSRLFNPFEQGGQEINREYGGLGLGLSICKSMVEAHGGGIAAVSDGAGKGATFTVRLPLARVPVAAEPAAASPVRATSAAAGPLRMLLVEDHADTSRIMSRMLRAKGYAVETAGDVASALACVKHTDFDLVISDLGLPDGSGLDLMRQLVASGLRIKAIAVSGYGTDDDLRKTREAGFAEHLVKPVNLPQLLAAIERVVGRRVPEGPKAIVRDSAP